MQDAAFRRHGTGWPMNLRHVGVQQRPYSTSQLGPSQVPSSPNVASRNGKSVSSCEYAIMYSVLLLPAPFSTVKSTCENVYLYTSCPSSRDWSFLPLLFCSFLVVIFSFVCVPVYYAVLFRLFLLLSLQRVFHFCVVPAGCVCHVSMVGSLGGHLKVRKSIQSIQNTILSRVLICLSLPSDTHVCLPVHLSFSTRSRSALSCDSAVTPRTRSSCATSWIPTSGQRLASETHFLLYFFLGRPS